MTDFKLAYNPFIVMVFGCISGIIVRSARYIEHIGMRVYWTKYGLLAVSPDHTLVYLVHNNGSCFKTEYPPLSKVYQPAEFKYLPNTCQEDYNMSLVEIAHGVVVRSLTPDEHVPDVKKLKSLAETFMKPIEIAKEGAWLTC